MIYTIDTSDIDTIVVALGGITGTFGIALYKVLSSYGFTWDVIKTKLQVRSDAAKLIKKQNDDSVVAKLGLSDELVQFLQDIAPNPDGTINEDAAMERIKACIAWQNIVIQNENHKKKLTPLEMKQP